MSQYYFGTAPSARLYVHDVKGFLWAAFGAVLLVDLPIALNQARMPAISAACVTLLIVLPTFLLAYAIYGGARKRTQFSVEADESQALEMFLASLGELDDSFVSELDEKGGLVTAVFSAGADDLQLQCRVVPLAGGCSHIYLSCKPVDPWKTIDFKNKSKLSLQCIRNFMSGLADWDYEHDSNVQRHHICHRPKSASRAHIVWFAAGALSLLAVIIFFRQQFASAPAWRPTSRNNQIEAARPTEFHITNRTLLVAPGESLDMPAGKRALINSLDQRIDSQYHYLRASLHDKGTVYAGLGNAPLARMQYEKAVRLQTLLYD